MYENGDDSPDESHGDEESQSGDKNEEVSVVASTDAIVHPWTVVIKVL